MKFFLRRPFVLILFFLLAHSKVHSQYVFIPDSAFRAFLISDGFAPAMAGDSLDTTSVLVTGVTNLNCSGREIQSLEGIQYFQNLLVLDCSVNYLTTINHLPTNLQLLNCKKNLLNSLDSLPASLTGLLCGHNQLTTFQALPNLANFECSNNSISLFPSLPNSLLFFDCDSNLITVITSLPPNLESLNISFNLVDSLPQVPATLRWLEITHNNIHFLPLLPDSLYYLVGSYNPLDLPVLLPSQLVLLDITSASITHVPPLPNKLEYLKLSVNNIDSLPTLPDSLRILELNQCNLTKIPALPDGLLFLNIFSNHIDSLPALPLSLLTLYCGFNNLTTLPTLPLNLTSLDAQYNHLTSLPNLPTSLKYLVVRVNLLSSLPSLNDSMKIVDVFSNQQLTCLPPIKQIGQFYWNFTNIACMPNAISISTYVYPPIAGLPLCQPSSGCPIDWSITGNVFHDLNNDCLKDTNEQSLKNIPVILDSAGLFIQSCFTNSNGDYSFRAQLGNYTVRINPLNIPIPFSCPATGSYTSQLTQIDSTDSGFNFALSCPNTFDLYAGSITPEAMFRPTRLVKVFVNAGDLFNFFGTSCYDSLGYVECDFSGPISYVSPALGAKTPTFVGPTTLRWNVNDFSTVDPTTDFNIEVKVDSFAAITSQICFHLSIYPIVGDIFPFDNTRTSCYPVRNSIDPNEKYMTPNGSVDTSDHLFNFSIFFQNTGNVPAEDIFILDTIDSDLEITSFELVSSTHNVVTQILPGNVLRFNFQGINLVDSVSNESMSHGHVNFRFTRNAATGMGTEITNTAFIYFDQNLPVVTNTVSAVVTSIVNVDGLINENGLSVSPNPSHSFIRIADKIKGMGTIEIRNLLGSKVKSFNTTSSENESIDISSLENGLYFLTLIDQAGRRTVKFIKN